MRAAVAAQKPPDPGPEAATVRRILREAGVMPFFVTLVVPQERFSSSRNIKLAARAFMLARAMIRCYNRHVADSDSQGWQRVLSEAENRSTGTW